MMLTTLFLVLSSLISLAVGWDLIFWVLVGSYILFLIIFSIIIYFRIPREARKRPEMPFIYNRVNLGSMVTSLENFKLLANCIHKGFRHKHYIREDLYNNGRWYCEYEVKDEEVVAVARGYESRYSQILDFKTQEGGGVYILSLSD